MLDGLKSKLGFASKQDDAGYDNGYYEEGYDDYGEGYDEYADYGPDYGDGGTGSRYDEGAAGARYGSYAPVTTRSPLGRGAREGAGGPKLVSIDDVKAHTQVPESLKRDPLPPRRTSSSSVSRVGSYRGERTMVDSSLPASLTPEGTAAAAAAASTASASRRDRSEGLNSLFAPTDAVGADGIAAGARGGSVPLRSGAAASPADAAVPVGAAAAHGAYDPYEAYAGAGAATYNALRSLSVIKPASYGEVERVAKILKAGDAVILGLRNTPDALAKRILDFSFGVASALDASVECVGDKVFAITRGNALTDAERMSLRGQGVL